MTKKPMQARVAAWAWPATTPAMIQRRIRGSFHLSALALGRGRGDDAGAGRRRWPATDSSSPRHGRGAALARLGVVGQPERGWRRTRAMPIAAKANRGPDRPRSGSTNSGASAGPTMVPRLKLLDSADKRLDPRRAAGARGEIGLGRAGRRRAERAVDGAEDGERRRRSAPPASTPLRPASRTSPHSIIETMNPPTPDQGQRLAAVPVALAAPKKGRARPTAPPTRCRTTVTQKSLMPISRPIAGMTDCSAVLPAAATSMAA